jgi:hypothetical protein
MAFPSAAFYGGDLRAGAPTAETRPLGCNDQVHLLFHFIAFSYAADIGSLLQSVK